MQLQYFKSMEVRRKAELRILELLGHFSDTPLEPREVTFWFFGEEYDIYRLADVLQKQEFRILSTIQSRTDKDEWLCISAKVMEVKETSFLELTEAMDDLAQAFNCRYDGHEMEI